MTDINQVVLIGRLTRDAELKYTNSGYAILKFSLAVNRGVKKDESWQEEASFFNAVIFGKRAESLAQYMLKGKQIGISGELKQDRWEQDGQSRSRVEIVVNNLQFLGSKGSGASQGSYTPPTESSAGKQVDAAPMADDFNDDIPF
ncbi:Single-stranded DNA-binding protein [subsurface metagenome]